MRWPKPIIIVALAAMLAVFMVPTFCEAAKLTFKGQTFDVPEGWPSEATLAQMEEGKQVEGALTEYAYVKQDGPGFVVYWFIGMEKDGKFTTLILTETWGIAGLGITECYHWTVHSDGTIRKISCAEFGRLIDELRGLIPNPQSSESLRSIPIAYIDPGTPQPQNIAYIAPVELAELTGLLWRGQPSGIKIPARYGDISTDPNYYFGGAHRGAGVYVIEYIPLSTGKIFVLIAMDGCPKAIALQVYDMVTDETEYWVYDGSGNPQPATELQYDRQVEQNYNTCG